MAYQMDDMEKDDKKPYDEISQSVKDSISRKFQAPIREVGVESGTGMGPDDLEALKTQARQRQEAAMWSQALSPLSQLSKPVQDPGAFAKTLQAQAESDLDRAAKEELRREQVKQTIARNRESDALKREQMAQQYEMHKQNMDLRRDLKNSQSGFSDKANRQLEVTLAQNLEGSQAAKDMQSVAQSMAKIQSGVSKPNPTDDIATVYNIVKMLDPGSVVREGEIDILRAAQGPAAKYASMWNNLISQQGVLSPEMRSQIYDSAVKQFNATKEAYDNSAQFYRERAAAYGLNPQLVVRDYGQFADKFKPKEVAPKQGEAVASEKPQFKVGEKRLDKNGVMRIRTERGWEKAPQ